MRKRTRLELSDLTRSFYEVVSSAGVSRLDLQAENIETLALYPQGNPESLYAEGEDADYVLDSVHGRVFFSPPPPSRGTMIVADGTSAKLFRDEEIDVFVESAFSKHTNNRNPAVNYTSLPPAEEHLVAILAKIEALWVLLTDAAYEINIHAPEGMFVPRQQRYQQLRELLQMTEAQYKELSNALGVGLYAIEMFTLRRVSRLTGRLVPIYLPQEIDDTRPPQRVFPDISAQGADVPQNSVANYDLHIFQGRPFEESFTLQTDANGDNIDLVEYPDFRVQMHRTPYAISSGKEVIPEFEVTVDPAEDKVTIALTAEDTKKLETTGSYVWDLVWLVDGEDGHGMVLLSGDVLVESSYPYRGVNVKVNR